MLDKYYNLKGKDVVEFNDFESVQKDIDEVGEAIHVLSITDPDDVADAARFLKSNQTLQSIAKEDIALSMESDSGPGDTVEAGISLFKKIYNGLKWIINKVIEILKKLGKWLGLVVDKDKAIENKMDNPLESAKTVGNQIAQEAKKQEEEGKEQADPKLVNRAENYEDKINKNKKPMPPTIKPSELRERVLAVMKEMEANKQTKEIQEAAQSIKSDLVYKIREDDWEYFAFNKRYEPFSPELVSALNNMAEYSYRLLFEIGDKLNPSELEKITAGEWNKMDPSREADDIVRRFRGNIHRKVAEIFNSIKVDRYKDNVTKDKMFRTTDIGNLNAYIEKDTKEFCDAIERNYTFEYEGANKDLFIPYTKQVVTQSKVILYIKALNKSAANLSDMQQNNQVRLSNYNKLLNKAVNAEFPVFKSIESILTKANVPDNKKRKVLTGVKHVVLKIIGALRAVMIKLLNNATSVIVNIGSSFHKQITLLHNTPVYLLGD